MGKDFSNKNLQNFSFHASDLHHADFSKSDLRGADFTGAELSSANFTDAKTGITPFNTVLLFIGSLLISLLSGYVAMLAGHTIQAMIHSDANNVKAAGYIAAINIILFIALSLWKGVRHAIHNLLFPVILFAIVIGIVIYSSGYGNGKAMFYLVLSLILTAVMFITGTIARAAAGSMSILIFWIVALAGTTFGRSIGGGIGTMIMAISCANISQRALKGAPGFDVLRNIASYITKRFGTSFRNSKMTNVIMSNAKIHNADFTDADLSFVRWDGSNIRNCNGMRNTKQNVRNNVN